MLLFTNENHTGTLHSEILVFTSVVYDGLPILAAKIQIKIENNHIIAHFYILLNTRDLIPILIFWQDNYD